METATYLGVIIFNDGYSKLDAVLKEVDCSTGTCTGQALAKLDSMKDYNKRRKSSDVKNKPGGKGEQ